MRRPIALACAAAVVVFVLPFLGFVVLLGILTDDTPVDCSQVSLPPPERWQALDGPDKQDLAGDLSFCSRFDGQPLEVVEASFGPPDQRGRYDDGNAQVVYLLPYAVQDDPPRPAELQLSIGPNGRVASVRLAYPGVYPN